MDGDPGTTWLMMLCLGVGTDLIWSIVVKALAQNKTWHAAIGNAMLAAVGLASTWVVVKSDSISVAGCYIVGCFIGTLLSQLCFISKEKHKPKLVKPHKVAKKAKSKKNHK